MSSRKVRRSGAELGEPQGPAGAFAGTERGPWCLRLAEAITDGRFIEDPGFWRPHVEACTVCRSSVEGLFALREHIADAELETAADTPSGEDARGTVGVAHARYRSDVRLRNALLGCGALLLVGGGFAAWNRWEADVQREPASLAGSPRTGSQVQVLAYADSLWRRVRLGGPNGGPDLGLLERDPAARAEYLQALDHPSSSVRREAVAALCACGVRLETRFLAAFLAEHGEDVPDGVEVAGAATRAPEELAARRQTYHDAKVRDVLRAAAEQAWGGGPTLPADVVLPYLNATDAAVRIAALVALAADKNYVADARIARVLDGETDPAVRRQAADLLVQRGGAAGLDALFAHLRARDDFALEQSVGMDLVKHPRGPEHAAQRVVDPHVPASLAWVYVGLLDEAAVPQPPRDLVERTVRASAAHGIYQMANTARKRGWRHLRAEIQVAWSEKREAWGADRDPVLSALAVALTRWDEETGDPGALALALDVVATYPSAATRPTLLDQFLARMRASAHPGVRARAASLSTASPR